MSTKPPTTFEKPGALYLERRRHKEGPPFSYLIWHGRTSCVCFDRKSVLAELKWPPKTPTGDAIREWLTAWEEFDQKAEEPSPELDMARIEKEGFGPEAHDDDDPTAQTKMVT